MTDRTRTGLGPTVRVRVRTFTGPDYPAVRRLWQETGLAPGPSDTPREIARTIERDPELFLVAVGDGRVVGAVLGRFDGRRGWVHHLAVVGPFRGRGIARRLLRELEHRLHRLGCPKVNLHVMPENADVGGFYTGCGYRQREMLFFEKWLAPSRTAAAAGPRGRSRARRPDARGSGPRTKRPGRPARPGAASLRARAER